MEAPDRSGASVGNISRTWTLAKSSWGVINHDRELLVIPVISAVVSLIVAAIFIVPIIAMTGTDVGTSGDSGMNGLVYVLGVLLMMALSVVSVVFQGALVSGAHERFTGGDPTIGSAIGGAVSKMHRLVPWALLTATVGLLLRMVRENMGFIGRILSGLLDMAWEVLTFLVVPVVMFEDVGPINGVKRSTELFKRTWGENLAARVGFGLLGFLLAIPAIALVVGGLATGFWVLIVIGVIWGIAISVVLSAMNAVFQTALYLYATTGSVPGGFAADALPAAFAAKER
jgi:hypothetical protein